MEPDLLQRQSLSLRPDPTRVVVRPFKPSIEPRHLNSTDKTRANHIVERVLALGLEATKAQLTDVLNNFEGRHRDLLLLFEKRASEMEEAFAPHIEFTAMQRQLIGAYFLHEYSFEAAALFNPSIVLHPDQSDCPSGSIRVIISLRAVGEGHVSSLAFLAGVADSAGVISIDPWDRRATIPDVLSRNTCRGGDRLVLAFHPADELSSRLIFPVTDSQSNGIEDARFVRFVDDPLQTYFATYTAYSGQEIRSELLQTDDFVTFTMSPLRGDAARNKGMALFPRKINGRYAMIARQDNENLYLVTSDDLYDWNGGKVILRPRYSWEFVQIGNCGSPIELDEGWLLLTHGVGPMRKYSIGAALLDKNDPSRVIARTSEPLVKSETFEREGYVPNVVYTCGGMLHNGAIILPYAVSDTFCNFATVSVFELLRSMTKVE